MARRLATTALAALAVSACGDEARTDSDDPGAANLQAAIEYALRNLEENERLARQLDKPLVLEEFGLARNGWTAGGKYDPAATTASRDTYFGEIFA